MPQQKVILITGASSGFGRLAAEKLADRGHRVYGTSRRLRPPEGLKHRMLVLDVRDDASVRSAVEQVLAEAGQIDVLINNAGYALSSLIEEAGIDQAKEVFETNFWGIVRMTKAVLPAMRSRRRGRIINVSSLAGLFGVPGEGFYSASKFAIEGYSESLAPELHPYGIDVVLVEPSYFRTGFDQARTQAADPIDDYDPIRGRVMAAFEEGARRGGDPAEVAGLLVRIVEMSRPRLRYRAGREAHWLPWLRPLIPQRLLLWGTRKWFHIPDKIEQGLLHAD